LILCLLAMSVVICAVAFKITVVLFKRKGLTWETAVVVALIVVPLSTISAFSDFPDKSMGMEPSMAAAILEAVSGIATFILAIVIFKKSLRIKYGLSIAMVGVALIFTGISAAGCGFGVRTFMVQAFRIPSSGMSPTLLVGDHLLANKPIYWFRGPRRGELLVFRYPADRSKDFLQRVIAVGGDTVEIQNKTVFINGKLCQNDPGVHTEQEMLPSSQSSRDNLPLIAVPRDCFFVMGDNRDRSLDSRFWGFVKLTDVVGRASVIYWSVDSTAKRVRTERIGKYVR